MSDGAAVSITTNDGNLTVGSVISGVSGGTNETLSIDAGTGAVTLQNVFGAGLTEDGAGLTDLTIVNSDTFNIGELAITGGFVQQNAATGNTVLNGPISVGSASLAGTNYVINDFQSASSVVIDATGDVTQSSGLIDVSSDPDRQL